MIHRNWIRKAYIKQPSKTKYAQITKVSSGRMTMVFSSANAKRKFYYHKTHLSVTDRSYSTITG